MNRLSRLAPVIALAAVALTGCALPKLTVEQRSLKQLDKGANLVEFETPHQPLLRVVAFDDKRPPVERKASTPSPIYLGLFNWISGQYRTGDTTWVGGPVADQVTDSIVGTMQKTNFFEKVQRDAAATPGGKGVILKGQIDSLQAVQQFKATNIFVLYFQTTKTVGVPVATCRMSYSLIDAETNTVLHQGKVEASPKDSNSTLTAVGARAVQEAETQMANEVTKILLEM